MMVAPGQPGERLAANWLNWGKVRQTEADVRKKADEVLDFLNLSHVADQLAGELSGGQKKLLELGRTMMTDAKLVLLDEPAAGVNRTLLRDEKLCDPVICMAEGRVLIEGDFQTVRSDSRVLEAYLGERAA